MTLAELSIKRPVTTIMLFVSLVVVGLIAAVRLPLELMPEMSAPFIFIQLPYPGSTPEEVERNILRPAEEAIGTMGGIETLRGQATSDGAFLFVIFRSWDTDTAIKASEARERLDAIRDQLPDDFQRYQVGRWSNQDESAITLELTSTTDLRTQGDRIEREFKQPLLRVPGVARVEVEGVAPKEVRIDVHPDAMSAHGVALNALVTKLRAVNFSVSAGEIEDGGTRLRVQPMGTLRRLDALRELVLDTKGTRLADIADVSMAPQRLNYSRTNEGRPMVGIDVYKERSANLVEVTRAVRAKADELRASGLVSDININVTDDTGRNVIDSLKSLAEAGLIGLLLSVIVLYYFLRHVPSTLMVTLAIPICFIMTLGFMYFFGVSLNILSMMGLLLAIGMLVDNAVVVVESIYQERERHPDNPRYASIIGTRHVAIALTAGTLCHCIVFLPNLFGDRNFLTIQMGQIAITITVSLLASWLVAVSLIPMLSARMKTPPAVASERGLIPRLQERYARFLRFTLEHRGMAVLGIVLVCLVSVVPLVLAKKSMMDGDDPTRSTIQFQWNGPYTREQMAGEVERVERYIQANRKRFKVAQLGSRYGEQGRNAAVTLMLEPGLRPRDKVAIEEAIRKDLPKSARAKLSVGEQGGDMGGGGSENEVSFRLTGDSTQTLKDIAQDLIPILAREKPLRDVRIDAGDRATELALRVDRERAAAYGFTTQEVASYIGMALRGANLREFEQAGQQVPVAVRFAGAEDATTADLRGYTIRASSGQEVPLLAMIDTRTQPAASRIQREDRQTTLKVVAKLAPGATMEEARKAMEEALKGLSLPAGYAYTFKSGGFEMQAKMMAQMMFNLVIALVMIYVVMAAVFESLLFPAAIMSCVVFSIFGVFWAMWLTGTTFNIMAFIGILVLMGVVVNNGIVMIEHINTRRRSGMSRTDALVEGSRERLRPILMTMGTAILAMIPIAVGNTQIAGEGPPYNPMARAIAGGLAFSTLVSLLFLPTIYAILDDWRTSVGHAFGRARAWRRRPNAAKAGVGVV